MHNLWVVTRELLLLRWVDELDHYGASQEVKSLLIAMVYVYHVLYVKSYFQLTFCIGLVLGVFHWAEVLR